MDIRNLIQGLVEINPASGDFLWAAINSWPARPGKALLRSIEARCISESIIREPVLDVGCGDGVFAQLLSFSISVGLDLDFSRIAKAKVQGNYRSTLNSDIRRIPFQSLAFSTVISNSVLDHILELEETITEIHRILSPGGRFVFTVPSEYKTSLLFFADSKLYDSKETSLEYTRFFDKYWKQKNYYNRDVWDSLLKKAGFNTVSIKYYEPPDTSSLIDLFENVRLVFKEWSEKENYVENTWKKIIYKLLHPYYIGSLENIGGGLFIEAEK